MINEMLYDNLCDLKDNYGIFAVKAEFEAEGSSFRDVVRLRSLTRKAGVDLYLKISGTEAVRDIKDALELDVDGIIVPMIENEFSIKKFFQAYTKIYDGEELFLTANIESKYALEKFDEICRYINRFSNVTFGRTDLSDSFGEGYTVDCEYITNIILECVGSLKKRDLLLTLGGSLSHDTISLLKSNKHIRESFDRVETRKIVMSMDSFLKKDSLRKIFEFEKLYILSKKEIKDICIEPEMKRLVELERRL